jgi:hypothetical protein
VPPRPADEKSTFERLQASLVLNRQPLLQPKKLPSLNPLDFQVRAAPCAPDLFGRGNPCAAPPATAAATPAIVA